MNQAKQSRIEFEAWEYILPAMQEIAKVSAKGFAKYGPGNWARVEREDNINHALRHLCLYRDKMAGVPLPEGEATPSRLRPTVRAGERRVQAGPVYGSARRCCLSQS